MARLNPRTLRQAYKESPLLPILLRSCRDLSTARNELRWLREDVSKRSSCSQTGIPNTNLDRSRLKDLCLERGKGVPLQYILGSQPFGSLDIICKRNVLIPRPETEAWTTYLAESIIKGSTTEKIVSLGMSFDRSAPLSILDLCSGSGCITLLLHALLSPHFPILRLLGFDASTQAVQLGLRNLRSNIEARRLYPRSQHQVRFVKADIFDDKVLADGPRDILVANPPYISPKGFDRDTSLSVRKYEPRVALVPPNHTVIASSSKSAAVNDQEIGDAFYPRLLDIAQHVLAKFVVLEVADMGQAQRVATLVLTRNPRAECEVWRDWPNRTPAKHKMFESEGRLVRIVGQGNGRAVVIKTNFETQKTR